MAPVGVCVKVSSLRPKYDNLSEWLKVPGHVLVTRRGRVFINKTVFSYPESPFANPFKLTEYTLDECLRLYEQHLDKILKNKKTLSLFLDLNNATEIGCFCEPGQKCHRDIIISKLQEWMNQQ